MVLQTSMVPRGPPAHPSLCFPMGLHGPPKLYGNRGPPARPSLCFPMGLHGPPNSMVPRGPPARPSLWFPMGLHGPPNLYASPRSSKLCFPSVLQTSMLHPGPPKLYGSLWSSSAPFSMVPYGPPWSSKPLLLPPGPPNSVSPQSSKTLWFLMVLQTSMVPPRSSTAPLSMLPYGPPWSSKLYGSPRSSSAPLSMVPYGPPWSSKTLW